MQKNKSGFKKGEVSKIKMPEDIQINKPTVY